MVSVNIQAPTVPQMPEFAMYAVWNLEQGTPKMVSVIIQAPIVPRMPEFAMYAVWNLETLSEWPVNRQAVLIEVPVKASCQIMRGCWVQISYKCGPHRHVVGTQNSSKSVPPGFESDQQCEDVGFF